MGNTKPDHRRGGWRSLFGRPLRRGLFLVLGCQFHVLALDFSGVVEDPSGIGVPGVEVRLQRRSFATITGGQGTWRISSPTEVVQDKRFQLVFDRRPWVGTKSYDPLGRSSLSRTSILERLVPIKDPFPSAIIDTLVFGWKGRVISRDTVSGTVGTFRQVFDTTLNPAIVHGKILDIRDGNQYRTVSIGGREWMAEELRYRIDSSWSFGGNVRFYTWASALGLPDSCNLKQCSLRSFDGNRGICPEGWRIPADSEWKALTGSVENDPRVGIGMAGKALKSIASWNENPGTDVFGFHATSNGYWQSKTGFSGVGHGAKWWSSTAASPQNVYARKSDQTNAGFEEAVSKRDRLTVRCVSSPAQPVLGSWVWRWLGDDPVILPPLPTANFAWIGGEIDSSQKMLQIQTEDSLASKFLILPIDLSKLRGATVNIVFEAKSDMMSQPVRTFHGVKMIFRHVSGTNGDMSAEAIASGTFGWTRFQRQANIAWDADSGQVLIGTQGVRASVLIRNLRFEIVRAPPFRPTNPDMIANGSMTKFRGFNANASIKTDQIKNIAKWKVNRIRWQLTCPSSLDVTDTAVYQGWVDSKIPFLRELLDSATQYGIGVVVDLHGLPGGTYQDGTHRLFSEKIYQQTFLRTWLKLAKALKDHPALSGYDLANEPSQSTQIEDGAVNAYELQAQAARLIRTVDPFTEIILETSGSAIPAGFTWLGPYDISNLTYSFHMYNPMSYTHQGVGKTSWDTLSYPGVIAGKPFDKNSIREYLQPARAFQLAYGRKIYVGEFSAVRWAPGAARYLADCMELFEEYGWDWTYHVFKEFDGWDLEVANDRSVTQRPTEPTDRGQVVKEILQRNFSN